jgi:hypothetical protein
MDSMIWWSVLQPGFTPTFENNKNQAYTVTHPIKISQGEHHFEFDKGHLLRSEHLGIISVSKGWRVLRAHIFQWLQLRQFRSQGTRLLPPSLSSRHHTLDLNCAPLHGSEQCVTAKLTLKRVIGN